MDELQLQYQAQQYWCDASDRAEYCIAKAVAHAARLHALGRGEALTAAQIRQHLEAGQVVRHGTDWDDKIRSRSAALRRQAQPSPLPPALLVQCDCGHWLKRESVMHASLGTACPDCYDRLSD